MVSSLQSAAPSAPAPELDPFRDVAGFLPLVPCNKCGTKLIGRVSQKVGSKGKRFYKCPLLEHTEFACGMYMFEQEYVKYLVVRGFLPRCCNQIRSAEASMGANMVMVKDGHDMLKVAVEGVETCTALLESATISLKDLEAKLKTASEAESLVCNKIDRIGERLLVLGVANLVVVLLVLMALMVK